MLYFSVSHGSSSDQLSYEVELFAIIITPLSLCRMGHSHNNLFYFVWYIHYQLCPRPRCLESLSQPLAYTAGRTETCHCSQQPRSRSPQSMTDTSRYLLKKETIINYKWWLINASGYMVFTVIALVYLIKSNEIFLATKRYFVSKICVPFL